MNRTASTVLLLAAAACFRSAPPLPPLPDLTERGLVMCGEPHNAVECGLSAFELFERGDVERSIPYLRIACEQDNHHSACGALASIHEAGQFLPQDLPQARALHEQACARNYGPSCSSLGHMLLDGLGGPVDIERGTQMITRCRSGKSEAEGRACFRYAEMLLDGRLPPDDALAYHYASTGCGANNAKACALQGRLLMQGRGTKHANTIDGAALLKQACDLGDAQACIDYSHTGSGWSEQQQQTFGRP